MAQATAEQIPTFNIRTLMDAGVHFGHKTLRWNPKMAPFIYGERNNIHILNLQQTVPMLYRALQAIYDVSARNGRILFVGTKRQASETLAESAVRCGQYYVNHRWLGGMLINWKTVSNSINTLKRIEEKIEKSKQPQSEEEVANEGRLTKKELLKLDR